MAKNNHLSLYYRSTITGSRISCFSGTIGPFSCQPYFCEAECNDLLNPSSFYSSSTNCKMPKQLVNVANLAIFKLVKLLRDKPNVKFYISLGTPHSTDLLSSANKISFDKLGILLFVERLNSTENVKSLEVYGVPFEKKDLAKIQEHLANNSFIEKCSLIWGNSGRELFYPVTLRNKFLKNQRKFNLLKSAARSER